DCAIAQDIERRGHNALLAGAGVCGHRPRSCSSMVSLTTSVETGIIPPMIHQKRLTLSLLAVALSLLLAACRQTPEGAAQPPPDASTPPPPTATTEPAPTPTPTPLPIEAVHQCERDLRNGDWDSAIAAFEQVLADPGASDDE